MRRGGRKKDSSKGWGKSRKGYRKKLKEVNSQVGETHMTERKGGVMKSKQREEKQGQELIITHLTNIRLRITISRDFKNGGSRAQKFPMEKKWPRSLSTKWTGNQTLKHIRIFSSKTLTKEQMFQQGRADLIIWGTGATRPTRVCAFFLR